MAQWLDLLRGDIRRAGQVVWAVLGHACLSLGKPVLSLIVNHIVNIIVEIVSVVEHVIICNIVTFITWSSLRRHVIIKVFLRIIIRRTVVIQIGALPLPLLLLAPSVLLRHLLLSILSVHMVRRTFCNSSLVVIWCLKAFLLLLGREIRTICPSSSTHGATCLNWASVSRQPTSTCIWVQVRLWIALHSGCTRLIACLLMGFERLVFLWRVSLIYQRHFLILLQVLGPNFWKMLLLNFVFLLMLSYNNLIQILWAPDRHCLDSLPCSICTLAIERGLV